MRRISRMMINNGDLSCHIIVERSMDLEDGEDFTDGIDEGDLLFESRGDSRSVMII
jgi:hypothetical protein